MIRTTLAASFLALVTPHAVAQHSLVYVPESSADAVGAASILDELTDQDVVLHTPSATAGKARKLLSAAQWNALLGDDDGDALFFEAILDEVNALARLPEERSSGGVHAYDLLFSAQEAFGEGYEDPVSDGSLWFLAEPGAEAPVEVYLDEEDLQIGLGTTSGLDIDAAAVAPDGTIFLSFKNDEMILGETLLLENGSVVAFEAASITLDEDGLVDAIVADSVQVILDEAAVDLMVTQAAITETDLTPIVTAGNLIALTIDPAGGTFVGTDAKSWPNLMFSAADAGGRVLTTTGGGAIAQLNAWALGASLPDGARLGLDGEGVAPAALLVVDEQDAWRVLDVDEGALSPTVIDGVLHLGNGTASGTALLFVALGGTAAGTTFPALEVDSIYGFTGLYTLPLALPPFSLPLSVDGELAIPFQFPGRSPVDVNVLIQWADLGSSIELSTPLVLAFDADGP